jgi:hypothetical protein
MQTLLQDLRYGLRILVNQPGFSLIAIITLALAIGANTAIFSIVDAVLFSPLSYPDSERLVKVNRVDFKRPRLGSPTSPLIPIEHISWDCLTIEAQGFGVIQKCRDLVVIETQTKRDFYDGFLKAYAKYRAKEQNKHEKFSRRFIKPDTIN